jgi:ParB-like chromosome segregation protein Spo0J
MRAHKFAEIFPLLEGSEFETLKADIAKRGVQVPIVTYRGEILDGRNRYRACQALGIKCPIKEHTGDDPLASVLSLNLHRRHLNESQRAMAAARLATMRQGARTDLDQPSANLPEVSQKQAAALLNVSDRLVRSAKNLQEKGSCRVIAAVDRGGVAVSTAERLAKGLETHEQDRLIDHVIENKLPPREIRREIHRIKAEKTAVPLRNILPVFSYIDQAQAATLKEKAQITLEGCSTRVLRNEKTKRWGVEVEPNENYLRLEERVTELREDPHYKEGMAQAQAWCAEAVELRRKAQDLEERARNMRDLMGSTLAGTLERTYGPAHCGQSIIIHVKDPEEDARLKTQPVGELIERLLPLGTTELADVESRLYCTDFRYGKPVLIEPESIDWVITTRRTQKTTSRFIQTSRGAPSGGSSLAGRCWS